MFSSGHEGNDVSADIACGENYTDLQLDVPMNVPHSLKKLCIAFMSAHPSLIQRHSKLSFQDADKVSSDSDVDTISESETEGGIQKSSNEE